MLDLVAQSPGLRIAMLVLLFAIVMAAAFFTTQAVGVRQISRKRLLETGATAVSGSRIIGSLRNERVESTWLKLVNTIEQRGISLVDTKDVGLRQRMIAAGFTANHAPRVYTLVRLILVVALPLLVLVLFAASGSSPSMVKLYLSLIIAAALGLYFPTLFI